VAAIPRRVAIAMRCTRIYERISLSQRQRLLENVVFQGVGPEDIASGPIPTFASHLGQHREQMSESKDHYQLIESRGSFEFDI
jgi:hypothetical protein